jgi:hypothetical protein
MTGDEKYMFEIKKRFEVLEWDNIGWFNGMWDAVNSDGVDGVLDFDGMVAFYTNGFGEGSTADMDAFRVNIWDDICDRRKNPENVVSYYEMCLFFSPESW